MASRERDIGRKYPSGASKRKKIEVGLQETKKQDGSILQFVVRSSNDRNPVIVHEIGDMEIGLPLASPDDDENSPELASRVESGPTAINAESCNEARPINQDDVLQWPLKLSSNIRCDLVKKGPFQTKLKSFPKDNSKRSFSTFYFERTLRNGTKITRSWLVYSESGNVVHCFACKLFGNVATKLSGVGCNDWGHIGNILKHHENSRDHLLSMEKWLDLSKRSSANATIDYTHVLLLQREQDHWKKTLERIIGIIQYLSKNNLAFLGSTERLYSNANGNFLGLVELFAKFDETMKEHVRRFMEKEISSHYLSSTIQKEIVDLMAENVKERICSEIKSSKYFSIILDCTPDVSHKEQMSVVIRYVKFEQLKCTIEEHFLGFLKLESQTGEAITEITMDFLKSLNIDIQNCRGQGYDNGSNMKGCYKGVQARILEIEKRAFYSPCSCHSLNLLLGDAAKSSTKAMLFFGSIQQLYMFFSSSPNRWEILKNNGVFLTLKKLSETRWECRYESVKAVRYQLPLIEDALHEVISLSNDPKCRSEGTSLLNTVFNYEFVLSVIIWHDILIKIHATSKYMQQADFQIDVAINQIKKVSDYLKDYRTSGFTSAEVDAREICEELGIERKFSTLRVSRKKRLFSYEGEDAPITDAKEKLRVEFFLALVDTAIECLNTRFTELKNHQDNFGFLHHIPGLKTTASSNLLKFCRNLETLLTDSKVETKSDVDGTELCDELQNLCVTLPEEESGSVLQALNYICSKNMQSLYPYTCIALQIILTQPVTVAKAERTFSRLKLIKTYLRSTLSQEHLNGLGILSIESEIAGRLDYKDLISEFAQKKARKVPL